MMNNDMRPTIDQLDALADLILTTPESDMRPELCELLQPLLAPTIFVELCARLEICPIHYCDIEICNDDNATDCTDYRN